jgi:3-deoxy-D-manno-octulosonic acid kinase
VTSSGVGPADVPGDDVFEPAPRRGPAEAAPPVSAPRWQHAVDQMNLETSEAAAAAFAAGEEVGARQFVGQPLRAFLRAWSNPGRERRSFAAVLAGYRRIVRAAKLWELEMEWRDQHLERFEDARWSGLVRRGWRDRLEAVLAAEDEGGPIAGGRGGTRRIATEHGAIIVRRFRRGGAMRWLGGLYFGISPRPFREFDLLLRARRRGLAVPEPIAAVVDRVWLFAYRGQLLTEEVERGKPILEFLRERPQEDLVPLLAGALRSLHDAGLVHPDLNLGNLLVAVSGERREVVFVDLDRARFAGHPLSARVRRGGLARLRRSAAKLDPRGRWLPASALDRMEALYWHADPAPKESEGRGAASR